MSLPINLDFGFTKYEKRVINKEIKVLDKLELDLIIVWCYPIDFDSEFNMLSFYIYNHFTTDLEIITKHFTNNLQEIY